MSTCAWATVHDQRGKLGSEPREMAFGDSEGFREIGMARDWRESSSGAR